MRILVVGAGATGGFYGGKLHQAGRDVTFLLRERRAEQIRAHGLEIVSPEGTQVSHPPVLTAAELRAKPELFDLILITTKSYQLESAIADLAPAVGPQTMLMPILNGMRQLDALAERFGGEHVVGGTVRIVSDLDSAGRIHQLADLDEMSYGELSGERTQRIEAVDRAMQNAGFDAILQPDILATLWQKWWILASMGAICILARGTVGEVVEAPFGVEFAHAVVKEGTDIATANGYLPNEKMLAGHLKRVTERGSSLTSSMYRDMLRGAPVEADHILGDLLDHAKGVPVPLLTAAYVQLKVYEAGRAKA